MIVTPFRNYGPQDDQQMTALVDADNIGTWAVRYLWIQHTEDNNKFYTNYFNPALTSPGMNVRKQTAELKTDWSAHNQIFFDSAANGDLVWRVKVGNPVSHSIDYIEVWRNTEILEQHFGDTPVNKDTWPATNRISFHQRLFEAGFDIRVLYPYVNISKELAVEYYNKFVAQHKNKDQCIINTPWNRELNPV
jgi:hypothetical protein